MTDVKTLIFRAQAGDEQAFADLLRAHYAFVYAIVMRVVGNPEDAEEVVQDVFVNAYRGLPRYEERTKFKPWLAKIARNRALNWMRDQKSENVSINDVREQKLQSPDVLAEQLIIAEHRELIRSALETLSPKDRKIARSYYLDGASYEELIRTHGLSYKAISVRLSRAKRKLAKRLKHLLTGVFVSPSMTFKHIGTGGLTVMKIGTVPKITVGAVAIIGLGLIGTRHFISPKEDSPPLVEIVTPTLAPQTNFTRKKVAAAPKPADAPEISAQEMQQIESFFAQLEEVDTQQNVEITKDEGISFAIRNGVTFLEEIHGEANIPPSSPQVSEAEIARLREEIEDTADQYWDVLTELKLAFTTSYVPPDPDRLDEEYLDLQIEITDLLVSYFDYTRNVDEFNPGGEIYNLFSGMVETSADDDMCYLTFTGEILYGNP